MATTLENLGPAERIINTVLQYMDHAVHNRPGMVVPANNPVGLEWFPVTHKKDPATGEKVVYRLDRPAPGTVPAPLPVRAGKKPGRPKKAVTTIRTRVGVRQADDRIVENGREVGRYRPAGLFPEVVTWLYRQVSDVWVMDNEFAARWASYAYGQAHKDLKTILAAFMLVQSRKGDPVRQGDQVAFLDEDYRDIGEAMMLLYRKDKDIKDLAPKLLLRIYDVLTLPTVAAINRELGFTNTTRRPQLGRWPKAVDKFLRFREENPRLLAGLIKGGYRSTVMNLARRAGYKPNSDQFFQTLRWKQEQADDGRRTIAIGKEIAAAESWAGLNEEQVCQRIMHDRPNWKRAIGLIPPEIGITRAVMAAGIEAGCFSDKDLVIATPTIEELGLMQVQPIRERWERATKASDDMRAANIAQRVKSKAVADVLNEGADNALKKAAEEVMRDIKLYVMVDRSMSQHEAIRTATRLLPRFLPAFPEGKLHVAYFNTQGVEVQIKHRSAAGVENAFRGVTGNGGTDYGSGLRALQHHKPEPNEDALFVFIGDQQARDFDDVVRASGITPMAFGFLYIPGTDGNMHHAVENTALKLGIPCFKIDEKTFEDPYAIPRTIHALVAATPVGVRPAAPVARRVSLVETILKTELLQKPSWAA